MSTDAATVLFSVSGHLLNITPEMALRLMESHEVKSKI
jgi:hypothetical protein